ncbi:signal peptidase I [Microbacterium trichothecenolyticum]|uniref:Signal peptidase I n=1 Tax=Microbacterium trichothecenolyticum TaxID=69370 RepID=A0ABU0TSQ4_MICTR|nr:signal peptidase I [Microbacterium trichothecenolyticum]MDQ1121952.1 signal peptidase I [Microbacterium trichothecenolyticum]
MSDQTASTPDAMASRSDRRRRRGWGAFFRDLVVIVLIALVVSFLVKTFVVRSFYIPSASMENTLMINDRILVDELTPRFGEYSRGDVVVFRDPGGWLDTAPSAPRSPVVEGVDWVLSLFGLAAPDSEDHLIKRVIGVAGDHVVCCNALGQTTVNGVPLDETYVRLPPGATAPEPVPYDVTVPEGSLWVLGDNRNSSRDSRFNQDQPGHGFVPVDNVVGRAFLKTWPLDRFGLIDFHHEVFAGVPAPGTGQ